MLQLKTSLKSKMFEIKEEIFCDNLSEVALHQFDLPEGNHQQRCFYLYALFPCCNIVKPRKLLQQPAMQPSYTDQSFMKIGISKYSRNF